MIRGSCVVGSTLDTAHYEELTPLKVPITTEVPLCAEFYDPCSPSHNLTYLRQDKGPILKLIFHVSVIYITGQSVHVAFSVSSITPHRTSSERIVADSETAPLYRDRESQ